MYRIKVEVVGDGSHPSEALISVPTIDGDIEKLVVARRSIKNGYIEIGYPVDSTESNYLVELPRETIRGKWRVWISGDSLVKEMSA